MYVYSHCVKSFFSLMKVSISLRYICSDGSFVRLLLRFSLFSHWPGFHVFARSPFWADHFEMSIGTDWPCAIIARLVFFLLGSSFLAFFFSKSRGWMFLPQYVINVFIITRRHHKTFSFLHTEDEKSKKEFEDCFLLSWDHFYISAHGRTELILFK